MDPELTLQQQRREEEQSSARSQNIDSSTTDDDRRDVSVGPLFPPAVGQEQVNGGEGHQQMSLFGPFSAATPGTLGAADFLVSTSDIPINERFPASLESSAPAPAHSAELQGNNSAAPRNDNSDTTTSATVEEPNQSSTSTSNHNRDDGRLNVRLRVPPGAHIHVVGPNGPLRRLERPRNMVGTSSLPGLGSALFGSRPNPTSPVERNEGVAGGTATGPSNGGALPRPSAPRSEPRQPGRGESRQPPGRGIPVFALGRNFPSVPLHPTFSQGISIPFSGNTDLPQMQTPRVESHVVPDYKQDFVDVVSEKTDLEKFKCAICYEYMDKPHGHSGCPTRVCESCAERLIVLSRNQNPTGDGALRCPICRNPCHFEEDTEMSASAQNSPGIRCRFAGCSNSNLRLNEVATHEATCPAVKVTCRYSCLGCNWVGPRGNRASHEEQDCALAKVSGLVDQHLDLLTNFQRVSFHLQGRLNGVLQLHQVLQQQVQNLSTSTRQHQRLQRNTIREAVLSSIPSASPNNPIHVAEYIVARFTNTTQQCPVRWKNMESEEAIASIYNQMMLLPVLLLSTTFCWHKLSLISRHAFSNSMQQLDLIDIIISCFCVMFGTIALATSFWLDCASSLRWRSFPLKIANGLDLGHLNLGTLASICSVLLFGILFLNAREGVGWNYACFYYFFISASSLLYPMLFLVIVKRQTSRQMSVSWDHGRAAEPLLEGMFLGFWWVQGPGAELDSEILLLLAILFFAFLKSSNFSRQAAIPIIGLPIVSFAALLRWGSTDIIDPTSLLILFCSTAAAWITHRIFILGISMVAESKFRPRGELSLLLCVWSWAMLLCL